MTETASKPKVSDNIKAMRYDLINKYVRGMFEVYSKIVQEGKGYPSGLLDFSDGQLHAYGELLRAEFMESAPCPCQLCARKQAKP